MNIKILYDNEALAGYASGWGFAALIDNDTLFDTGENEASLLSNMQLSGVEPMQLKNVILSHEDWDHIGGISIIKRCKSINIYVPAGVSSTLRHEINNLNPQALIFEADGEIEIDSKRFVTATMGDKKKEISLVVRTGKGQILITGCAHPGLDVMMTGIAKHGDIYAVAGGFHGFDKLELLHDVEVILPCHCTSRKHEIEMLYPDNTLVSGAGMEYEIG